ncbi:MAG: hypothetical protein QOE90_3326 [Thermoplasmata archaeon]|nr:hypothetical protein [Thermoplasmata archaeon]
MGDPNRPSYVALFDILGFRNLVAKHSREPEVLAERMIEARESAEKMAAATDCFSIQFSDSILLFTKGIGPDELEGIVMTSNFLIRKFLTAGFPLRGGLAAGSFYFHHSTYLGTAMNRAYELEQSQDWIGGIVDPALGNALRDEDPAQLDARVAELHGLTSSSHLIEYPAPIKGGPVGNLRCFGWPLGGRQEAIRSILQVDGSESWEVLRKIENTERFQTSVTALREERRRRLRGNDRPSGPP